jgi:D-alanyl-D-alanine carboxypeptidase/D-alanyl-D-alanine-endopeptidase (penicillin-binding protein 4)
MLPMIFVALLLARDASPQEEPVAPEDGGVAAAVHVGPAPGEDRVEWLKAQLDAAVSAHAKDLGRARIGIAAADLATGRSLYAKNADDAFNAASNTKLVTVAVALSTLGPEYRYRTTLFTDDAGNLYVKGGGDPSLTRELLLSVAIDVRLAGITKITGAIVIDPSLFDAQVTPPAFAQKLEDDAFRAPISAVALNYNSVLVRVSPNPLGGPARIVAEPPGYVQVVGGVATVGAGRTAIRVAARALPGLKKTQVLVTGTIRRDATPQDFRKRIDFPEQYLGEALRTDLMLQGIDVAVKPIEVRAVPATAKAILFHESAPLGDLVRDLSKYSNNFMAEMILKRLGASGDAPATWAKGTAVVTAWLEAAGVPAGSYRYENGSGLYDSNRFSPAQLVRVIRRAATDFKIAPEYVAALAIAGVDGTLAHRMVDTPAERRVRAKTGTQNGVSALSGLAGGVAFSVLINDVPRTAKAIRAARALEDDVAIALASYGAN